MLVNAPQVHRQALYSRGTAQRAAEEVQNATPLGRDIHDLVTLDQGQAEQAISSRQSKRSLVASLAGAAVTGGLAAACTVFGPEVAGVLGLVAGLGGAAMTESLSESLATIAGGLVIGLVGLGVSAAALSSPGLGLAACGAVALGGAAIGYFCQKEQNQFHRDELKQTATPSVLKTLRQHPEWMNPGQELPEPPRTRNENSGSAYHGYGGGGSGGSASSGW
ncbi:MAG: hypothetical protein AB7S38_10895 [Vulcanimicrobiota bacterium]